MSYLCMYELKGHCCPIYTLTIYNNSIISGSGDGTIKIWRIPGQSIKLRSNDNHSNINYFLKLNLKN